MAKQFRLQPTSVSTIGGIQQTQDGFGFTVREAENGYSMWKPNVFLHEGRVLISTELFTTLAGQSWYIQPDAKIGRKRLFDIETHADHIIEHITYGCRNDNERAVRQRNQAIFEWLIALL